MKLKSDAKFEEKLTLGFKNDMRNSVIILMRSVASLKIWTLICYFCRKYIMFAPKKGRELRVIALKNEAKFEEELTCTLKMT